MTQANGREPRDSRAVDIHEIADTLWKSADALRGQVDAAEYKHVVLGLLFLKYISDSFESRRDDLKIELERDGISGKQLESLSRIATSTPQCRPNPAGPIFRTRRPVRTSQR